MVTKAEKEQAEIKQAITDGLDSIIEVTDEARDSWDTYLEKEVKASAKRVRKMTLELKKKAAAVRALFKELTL